MSSRPPQVAVIGGSIAGCAAAVAAHRAGCDVTVFERSSGDLSDRGFGVTLPSTIYDTLIQSGYLDPDAPALAIGERLWITREPGNVGWRELWRQAPELVTCNWGLLWKGLRASVPDDSYRADSRVTAVRPDTDGRGVVRVDGRSETSYDLVIGADGYRSLVRGLVAPDSVPGYAGYIAFRGVTPLERLEDDDPQLTELLYDKGFTVMYANGHMIIYAIPDVGEGRLINWVLYYKPPTDIDVDPSQVSFASGSVVDEVIADGRRIATDHLPARIAQIVTETPDTAMAVQPVFDLTLESSARAPFLLVGDANTITRPHTGSGAVKALQDALSLEQSLLSASDLGEAITAYNTERNPGSNLLVELGRRIGRDQVEHTPDWTTMDAKSMGRYVAATWSGQEHYLFTDE